VSQFYQLQDWEEFCAHYPIILNLPRMKLLLILSAAAVATAAITVSWKDCGDTKNHVKVQNISWTPGSICCSRACLRSIVCLTLILFFSSQSYAW
jgi:hypothetical protein